MSESLNSIFEAIKLRLNNKLSSSIALSWCVINYKFFMVVFGGGNYESKINYIKNSLYDPSWKNWQIYWLPIIIGIAYVVIIPFISIGVNIIGEMFKNLERQAVLWGKKRQVVSVNEKEIYFADLATINQGVKDELTMFRSSESEKMKRQIENINGVEERLRNLALRRLTTSVGLPAIATHAVEAMLSMTPPYMNAFSHPQMYINNLCDSDIFKNLQKLADYLGEQQYDRESRKFYISKAELQGVCGMGNEEFEEFTYYILAVKLLKEVDYPDYGYLTSARDEQRMMRNIFNNLIPMRQ